MLEGPLAEKGKIPIVDVTKDSFTEFLRYLYSDVFQPTWDTLIDVLYCAKNTAWKLCRSCASIFSAKIFQRNMSVSLCFDMKDITALCISVLEDDTKECIGTPGLLASSKECISTILNLDKVNCREEDMYEGVMRWAGEECRRQKMKDTPANYRAVLGDQI